MSKFQLAFTQKKFWMARIVKEKLLHAGQGWKYEMVHTPFPVEKAKRHWKNYDGQETSNSHKVRLGGFPRKLWNFCKIHYNLSSFKVTSWASQYFPISPQTTKSNCKGVIPCVSWATTAELDTYQKTVLHIEIETMTQIRASSIARTRLNFEIQWRFSHFNLWSNFWCRENLV